MNALFLRNGILSLEEASLPEPAEGEALIRPLLMGVCSTDLELCRGYYPYEGILGHEFVGVVERCDSARQWVGRRVVGTINLSPDCGGKCGRRCPEHCPDRRVLGIVNKDGCFAEALTLPVANLLPVPEPISDEAAVFTEPLAAACRIAEQVEVKGRSAIVIGPGRLGLLCAQVLRHERAEVTVLGRSEESLKLPAALGFETSLDSPTPASADLVVEATANEAGLRAAVEMLRPGGVLVLKSTYADEAPGERSAFEGFAPVLAKIVVDEIQVIGSRCGPFPRALELLEQGVIDVESTIDAIEPLENAVAALRMAGEAGVRKVLLRAPK